MNELAQILVDLVQVVSDARDAQPGKPVRIDVLPGFNAGLPTAGTLTGPLAGVLNTLVLPVTLAVAYEVKIQINATTVRTLAFAEFSSTPSIDPAHPPPPPLDATKLLSVAFLLLPPFGEDVVATEPFHYQIDVTLTLSVDSSTVSKTITVPVDMPALPFPSLLLLGRFANFATHDGDDPGKLLVMVRASSALRDLGSVVTSLNRIAGVITTLQTFCDFGTKFLPGLQLAARLIGSAPVVYFNVGNVHNTDDDGNDFDDDASCLLLIGVTDDTQTIPNQANVPTIPGVTQVTLFSKGDFNLGLSTLDIDAEHTTFSIELTDEIVISRPGLQDVRTGVGIKQIDDFSGISWATEQGDNMDVDT